MTGIEIGASAIGAALLGLIVYFLKARDARINGLDKQAESNSKDVAVIAGQLETISKRLSAGSESFKDITQTQKQLQENQTYILTHFVEKPAFEKEQDRTVEKFDKVDKTIEGLKETVTEVRLAVEGIENKLEGGIKTMTALLAKIVTIPGNKNDV